MDDWILGLFCGLLLAGILALIISNALQVETCLEAGFDRLKRWEGRAWCVTETGEIEEQSVIFARAQCAKLEAD